MIVRRERHFAVRGPRPRALHLHAPATERDLPILATVPDRGPVRVPSPLRADELLNLLLQQFAQHPQPDLDRQREYSLPRSPNQMPQSLFDTLREHALIINRLSDRYLALHGGSSFDLWWIARHAPTRSGRAGGIAVTSKFYEPRDNLAVDRYAVPRTDVTVPGQRLPLRLERTVASPPRARALPQLVQLGSCASACADAPSPGGAVVSSFAEDRAQAGRASSRRSAALDQRRPPTCGGRVAGSRLFRPR